MPTNEQNSPSSSSSNSAKVVRHANATGTRGQDKNFDSQPGSNDQRGGDRQFEAESRQDGQGDQQGQGQALSSLAHFNSAKETFASELERLVKKIDALAPREGLLAQFGTNMSSGLTKTQHFLTERSPSDMASIALSMIRRYPLAVVLGGAGVGLGVYITRRRQQGSDLSMSASTSTSSGTSRRSSKGGTSKQVAAEVH